MKSNIRNIHFFNGSILKFVKPIWYHSIFTKNSNNLWINYWDIDERFKERLNICDKYSTIEMTSLDASYQLIQNGYVNKNLNTKNILINFNKSKKYFSIEDQYLFVRRMFKPFWVYYALLLRIIFFKVQINDFLSIFNTRNVLPLKSKNNLQYNDYDLYNSDLIKQKPLISIILPTLNRYEYLRKIIEDLEKQTYKNFELIVIDQSEPFRSNFYNSLGFKVEVLRQKDKALWKARNYGIKISKGNFFLFLDDDSKVTPNWIYQHIKCIDYFNADISAGISISKFGAPVPYNYKYFRWADQLDTGNVLIKENVFKKCGLFDLQFEKMRMGDAEFGLRAKLNGFKSINNPLSKRIHYKVKSGGLREIGSWDGLRPKNFLKIRPIPSVLYFYRSYWGDDNALSSLIQTIPFSLSPYSLKGRFYSNLFSFILFIFFSPIFLIQVIRSWFISSKMIKQGSKIENY